MQLAWPVCGHRGPRSDQFFHVAMIIRLYFFVRCRIDFSFCCEHLLRCFRKPSIDVRCGGVARLFVLWRTCCFHFFICAVSGLGRNCFFFFQRFGVWRFNVGKDASRPRASGFAVTAVQFSPAAIHAPCSCCACHAFSARRFRSAANMQVSVRRAPMDRHVWWMPESAVDEFVRQRFGAAVDMAWGAPFVEVDGKMTCSETKHGCVVGGSVQAGP